MKKEVRRAVIAGNWKMNLDRKAAKDLIEEMKPLVSGMSCEIVVCVPFTDLEVVGTAIKGTEIRLGAQNCHYAPSGAFTGEISTDMLVEMGVQYVIVGHSERRQYFGETDITVNQRLRAALDAGLNVILCVGEQLQDREMGITDELVAMQTKIALQGVTAEQLSHVLIAYEPVWAIGTGKTATAEQAEEVCAMIRQTVASIYNENVAQGLTIQYGGSMNSKNAEELLSKTNVDGGLIGGASLKAADFATIVKAASQG